MSHIGIISSASECGTNGVVDISNMKEYNFTSPGYPYGYAPNLHCEWLFSTRPENHLSIYFTDMDLDNPYIYCTTDTISLYTGVEGKQNWKLFSKFCKRNATDTGLPPSNLLKVVFDSDYGGNQTGFSAIVCNGK